MSIFPITRNKQMAVLSEPNVLKTGQIVRGTIHKIYPNQHAEVKLGNQVIHAQLEAPLQVGESYYFQVDSLGENIYLKVIQANHAKHPENSVQQLMNHLQLSHHGALADFLQSLLRQHIPFSAQQIKSADALLSGAKNKAVAQYVLQRMIRLHLPMTQHVFEALYTSNTENFSEQLSLLLQQLNNEGNNNQSILSQHMISRIEALIHQDLHSGQALINQILYDVNINDQRLFHLFKSFNLIEQVEYGTWKSTWETLAREYVASPSRLDKQLPFQLELGQALSTLSQIQDSRHALTEVAKGILQQYGNKLMNNTLTAHEFTLLKNDFKQQIALHLPDNTRDALMRMLQHNEINLRQVFAMLETLASEQTYQKIDEVLLISQSEHTAMFEPKELFLNQLQRVLLFTGLNDENNLINDQLNQITSSLKHMLLQSIEQSDFQTSERLQPFIHMLNGLQLQSIYETNHFIFANLVIPGKKLQLNSDIQLEFESKKTADDKIDPDFCRIIFILELNHLRETMLDMQIQNRIVSLTIFNDHQTVKDLSQVWQPLLKEGLAKLRYQLSNVTVKPFHEQVNTTTPAQKSLAAKPISHEGIDYRI